MKEKNEEITIDLQKLLMVYFRKLWLILLCLLLGAGAMLIYTKCFVVPTYRASVTVYVNNTSAGGRIDSISSASLSTSQQLVNTYVNIMKSDTVLTKVVQQSELDSTVEEIREMMSAEQVGETEMFNIYIIHSDPGMATRIANAVAMVAPGEIEQIVEGSSTKIIDYAKVPKEPYSPNVQKNVLIGAVAGCFLALAYLTLAFLLDVRIKTDEDLTALFDLPILGQVPDIASITSGSGKRYGYGTESTSMERRKEGDHHETVVAVGAAADKETIR